jgi:hypothetical protein
MSEPKHIILPNTHKLWEKGVSISLYSRGYDPITHKQDFTELGQAVYEYKYYRNLPVARRQELVRLCSGAIVRTLKLEQQSESIGFNSCIGVMPNGNSGVSLPLDLAIQLSIKFDWLRDDSNCLTKVKELPVMKGLSDYNQRNEALKNAYGVNLNYDFEGVRGFLIIDDVFESGSTLREICRTLERVVPEIPRFVLTLTHLRKVWDAPR